MARQYDPPGEPPAAFRAAVQLVMLQPGLENATPYRLRNVQICFQVDFFVKVNLLLCGDLRVHIPLHI